MDTKTVKKNFTFFQKTLDELLHLKEYSPVKNGGGPPYGPPPLGNKIKLSR
jgi:hypothetical protein